MHFAFRHAVCLELIATYGETDRTPDVFSQLRIIATLLIAYACVSTLIIRKHIRTKSGWVFQIVLIGATFFFGAWMHHIQIRGAVHPDGVMNSRIMVWSSTEQGPTFTPLQELTKRVEWVMGERFEQEGYYEHANRPQCVWLKQGIITGNGERYIEGYNKWEPIERMKYRNWTFNWEQTEEIFSMLKKDTLRSIISKEPMLEILHQFQINRPLQPEERERFITQQACIEASKKTYSNGSECIWRFGKKYEW